MQHNITRNVSREPLAYSFVSKEKHYPPLENINKHIFHTLGRGKKKDWGLVVYYLSCPVIPDLLGPVYLSKLY